MQLCSSTELRHNSGTSASAALPTAAPPASRPPPRRRNAALAGLARTIDNIPIALWYDFSVSRSSDLHLGCGPAVENTIAGVSAQADTSGFALSAMHKELPMLEQSS